MGQRLRPGMLAAAEADLQPEPSRPAGEGGEGIGRVRRVEPETGQRLVQKKALPGPERVALGAAIQPVGRRLDARVPGRGGQRLNACFSAGTRSVFSQVNVPSSGSGVRPKWP